MSDRIRTVSSLFLAVLIVAILIMFWSATFKNPAGAVNRDFLSFALAAKIVDEDGYQHIYQLDRQKQAMEEIINGPHQVEGGVLPFIHPPFLMPLMNWVIGPNLFNSFLAWTAVSIGVLALCLKLSADYLIHAGWQKKSAVYLLAPLALFLPVHITLLQGQDIIFLLLGVVIFLVALQQNRLVWGGFGLALTTLTPHIALLLGIPLFFSKRNWFYSFVGWSLLFAIFSISLIGINGVFDYLDIIGATASAEGRTYGVNKNAMTNLIGLTLRLWPAMSSNTISTVTWGGYLFGMGSLCWLHFNYRKATENTFELVFAFTIAFGLFFVPHLHSHSLLLLWVPLLVWAHHRVQAHMQPLPQIALILLMASTLIAPLLANALPFNWVGVFVVIFSTMALLYRALKDNPS